MIGEALFRIRRKVGRHLLRRRLLGPGPAGPSRRSVVLYFDYEREFGNPLAYASAEAGFRGVLPALERHGIQATWCTVGLVVDAYPDTLAELCAHGHEIACHTYTHRDLTQLSSRELGEELARFRERCARLCGVSVRGFHPPLDRWTLELPEILRRYGYAYDIARDDDPRWLHAQTIAPALRPLARGTLRLPSVADDWRYMSEDVSPAEMTASWLQKLRAIPLGGTVAIGFHPWVLGAASERLAGFADFLEKLVADPAMATYTGAAVGSWYGSDGRS